MVAPFNRILVVFVMTILVAIFAWIYGRDRQPRARYWLIGWIAIEVHFASALLAAFKVISPVLDNWLYCVLLVAAAAFFHSVSEACRTPRRWLVFWSLMLAPAIAYWTAMSLDVKGLWPYRVLLGIVVAAGVVLALTRDGKRSAKAFSICLLVAMPALLAMWQARNPMLGMEAMLFEGYALTGMAYWRHYRRFTPGVVLTSASFLAWGMVWPVAEMLTLLHTPFPPDVTWDLPKYFVAFGMIMTLFENQTEVLQREVAERKKAEEKANAADQAKSIFLASMSHEIRTPMNGIIGMTDLVMDTPLTGEQREDLGMVKSSAESLLSVINDILDFSKVEAGKMEFEHTGFDLYDLLGELIRSLGYRANQKSIELIHDVRPEAPPQLVGDAGRLRQVLVNLVGNAIKFTSQGEVVLTVSREAERDGGVVLHFVVSDTGPGIPEEKRRAIFEPFTQADESTQRKFGGTGLGLTISARLVQMMGGEIWVETGAGGVGSAFHFTAFFGLDQERREKTAPLPIANLQGLPLLIVDDNATNRRLLVKLLRKWSMQPVAVSSGQEALDALRQSGARTRLILLDSQMPGMDGFETARRIREDLGLTMPIVLLRSIGSPGEAALRRKAGIQSHLNKPLRQEELLGVICEAIGDQAACQPLVQEIGSPARKPPVSLRVLLAEDHPVNCKLAVRLLERGGYRVTVARNGKQALEAFQASEFDVALVDIQMPEMDGFELTRAIRHHEASNGGHLPIIALTAHAMKGDDNQCRAGGMDGYLSKPIDSDRLFGEIDAVLAPSAPET